jgi:hypothetical protein
MQGERNNRPCPSFEGYKSLHCTRRKGGDEPPHHGRNSRCSRGRLGYRGRLCWLRRARATASQEPDTPFDQRRSPGPKHPDGKYWDLAGEGTKVRVPVASVRLVRSGLRRDQGCDNFNKDAVVGGYRANTTGDCDGVEPEWVGGRNFGCDKSGRICDEYAASSAAARDRRSSNRHFSPGGQWNRASRSNADRVHRFLERDDADYLLI